MLRSKIVYGCSLIALLIAFSLPWYVTTTSGDWREKMLPNPNEQFFIGSKPYTGWGILPLTIPSVIGFVLSIGVLFTKSRPMITVASGILLFTGVLIGLFGAPPIIKTWVSGDYIYGTGWPGLEQAYILAFITSIVCLISSFMIVIEMKKSGLASKER